MSEENGAIKAFANLHPRTENQTFKNEVGEPMLTNPTLLPFDNKLNPVAIEMHLPDPRKMLYHDQLNSKQSKQEPSSPMYKPLDDEEGPMNPAYFDFDPEFGQFLTS